ncbi:proline-rich protein HaeIII subfamily 1-like [Topomyia yanbarensis]|uniref:proline-rich protein HaeIII subfamily 1-like n=1 Tax=Topomyia yanbarensis TaxID=2498891 RepID=UPI00273AD950|nr:proline-rich protein HaeIII subfamily 1-like [Topomyia yanbarensis]
MIAAQTVVPVQPQGQFIPPGYFEYPSPVQAPLTPINAAVDGYYGYNPYLIPGGSGIPQQTPFANVPFNLPYGPGVPAQNSFINPAYNNVVPPGFPAFLPPQFPYPGFQQVPPFVTMQQFSQSPPPLAGSPPVQQQIVQHGRPFSDAAAVSFTSFQGRPSNSSGPIGQGVNSGVPRPVVPTQTPYVNSINGNTQTGGYGSAYGQFVPAVGNTLNPAAAAGAASRPSSSR